MYYMWKTNESFGQGVSYAGQVVYPIGLSDWTTYWKNKCRTLATYFIFQISLHELYKKQGSR